MIVDLDTFLDFGLPDVDTDNPAGAREAIAERFKECGHAIPVAEMSAESLQALPPVVLIAWHYHYDCAISIFAVPEAELSDELRSAFEQANYSAWAYDELMYGDDDALAFIRIDHATLNDHAFEGLLESIEEEVPGFVGDKIRSADRSCLASYRVAYFERGKEPTYEPSAFDKRIVATYSVTRAV